MTERFDLAIIDLRLTDGESLEGLELISKIKAQTPGTQAVLYTAYGSPEIEQEALKRGAVDYWEKSLQLPNMLERLNALGILAGRGRR
jgi:DNA-binding NtrC family response regulator